MKLKRVGKLKITVDVLESDSYDDMISKLRLRIFRAELMYGTECIDVECYCPYFDELDDGECLPDYQIIVSKSDDYVRYDVKRVE